ncbi:hypothetical protein F3D3_3282 [Fusibacter sp. 3D3]|nr:hypothetical protein F3D3_3282 [Fusibacter sp. 3D3]
MLFDIVRLIHDGVITMDDLLDFSDDLRDYVKKVLCSIGG